MKENSNNSRWKKRKKWTGYKWNKIFLEQTSEWQGIVHEIKIWPYYLMVYAQTRIHPWE